MLKFFSLTLILLGLTSSYQFTFASELYRGPIVDVHMHAYSNNNPMFGAKHIDSHSGKTYQGAKSASEHKRQTFERIERYNIVKVMLSTNEDWLAEHPDLIMHGYGFAVDIATMRKKHSQGKLHVIGEIAPSYQDLMPNDQSVLAYFDLANELDVPIAYHMFPGGQPGGAYTTFPKIRARQVKPLALEDILLKRPNMRIYIMHAGWPYIEDMKALMYAHPQVYVDTGVLSLVLPTTEVHEFLRQMINAGLGKRIMFGSDQMVFVDAIDKAIADIQSAEFLTAAQKADIFYNNAARFFRFSDKEIKTHHSMMQKPPPLSIQQQITLANRQWMNAVTQGNLKALAALYTENGIVIPPHSHLVQGQAQLEKLLTGFIASKVQISLETLNVEQYQDMAFEVGQAVVKNLAGEVLENSHYLVIWKNVNGQWKMHRDMWNQRNKAP